MALAIGERAPKLTLISDDGKTIALSDFAGKKVVLYFYPKDDTPGCTREARDFRDRLQDLHRKGAVVLGVSRDSVDSHRRFKAKHGLPFALLSDPDAQAHKAFGAWGEKVLYGKRTTGVIRSTVLVDEDGNIAKVWPKVKVDGHVEQVLAEL